MKKIATVLALLCALVLSAQNYSPIVNYAYNGTPTNGIKIKTNIPFQNGLGMPTLILEGYQYGGKRSIGLILNWYVYGDNFYYPVASSFGSYTPEIKLIKENNKVVIFIEDKQYYNRFTIRGYAQGQSETTAMFSNWLISDELPVGSPAKSFVYKNKFAGIVEVDGKLSIGGNNPKAPLDVQTFIPNGTLGSVFGRLEEGNVVGDGTYLGVKGHKTQGDPNTIKSFSLVHNFYGETNSSVNFYRGSGVLGGFLTFNTLNDTERMRINYDGNIGIGTTSPKSKLHISGGSNNWNESVQGHAIGSIHLDPENSTNNYGSAITFGASDYNDGDIPAAGIYVRSDASYGTRMYFSTTNSYSTGTKTALAIDHNGNVGIGSTNPSSKLHVAGSGAIIKLQNTSFEDTDNQFYGWLGGYDKSGDEIWWIGEGSSTGKQLGLFTNRAGYDLKLFNKGRGIIVKGDGNIGIGTESPKSKLQVSGGSNDWNESIQGSSVGSIHLNPGNSANNYGSAITFGGSDHGNGDFADAGIYVRSDGAYGTKMYFSTTNSYSAGSKTAMAIDHNGNVGVGTTDTKGFKFGVNGKIAATEVKVANFANWADFVFAKDYNLPSLEEVENHIKRKGHLENIPSAKEVKTNGFYLGEMDAKLLQKIEELTLYTIQQNKEIKKAKEENKNLKLVLKKLEERLSKLEKNQ